VSDIDAWLSQGSRPEADVPICLVGDLAARYQAAAEELVQVAADPNRSIEDARTTELAAELDELQRKMEGATRIFRMRALPPEDYLDLQVKHPPREGNEVDQRLGCNRSTFLPVLVKACTVTPELTDEQWDALLSKLSSRQWDELWVTAQQLNREDVRPPKSLGISAQMQTSGGKSKQRGRSASPSNGSAGGSRKRSTSTTKKAG
jgi:hypothetical protein